MYKVSFYKDQNGNEPVREFMAELAKKKDKDSRINFNKIRDYINMLSEHGTRIGEPYVKHLDGDIWELRPIRNRILFFAYDGENFVLLSHFVKKTQKTPKSEIDKAKSLMKDYLGRRK